MAGVALASILFLNTALAATQAPGASGEPAPATYAGEVIVRTLGESRLVVAIDEIGEGAATRLFLIETAGQVEPLALSSAVSRIEKTPSGLLVSLPREHRSFVFTVRESSEPGTGGDRPKISPGQHLAATRIEGVRSILEYRGNLSHVLQPEVTLSFIGTNGLQAFRAPYDLENLVVGSDPPPNGGGCVTQCSTSCGDGSSCSATCSPNQCGTCSCTFGASCSCK